MRLATELMFKLDADGPRASGRLPATRVVTKECVQCAWLAAAAARRARTSRRAITLDITLLREPCRAFGGVFGGYRWLRKRLVLIITG